MRASPDVKGTWVRWNGTLQGRGEQRRGRTGPDPRTFDRYRLYARLVFMTQGGATREEPPRPLLCARTNVCLIPNVRGRAKGGLRKANTKQGRGRTGQAKGGALFTREGFWNQSPSRRNP
jgi:hypothetical protein